MNCISPITLRQKVKDAFDVERETLITVPCGKCAACLSRRKDDWIFRLKKEFYNSKYSVFVTLTYNDLSVPTSPDGTPSLRMADVSDFMKRLRKRIGTGVRFFGCGEYGKETNRPHYHLLLFNVPETVERDIRAAWPWGHIKVDTLTEGRIAYTCKYVLTSTQMHDGLPFTFGSNGMSARNLLYDLAIALQSALVSLPKLP